jgi:hypothetical protein
MHAQARVLAVPRSTHDSVGCCDPDAGPRGVLSRPRPDLGPVAGVQARSEGLRSAASRGPTAVATADKQQTRATRVSHRLATLETPISERYAADDNAGRPAIATFACVTVRLSKD